MIVVAWDAIRAGLATQQTQYRGALVHAPSLSARTCPHALVVHTRPRAHPSTCTPAHHTHTTHQHHHTKHAIMQTHQHQLAHTHHQTSTGARADTRPHGHAHSHTGKGRRTRTSKTCSWRRVAGKQACTQCGASGGVQVAAPPTARGAPPAAWWSRHAPPEVGCAQQSTQTTTTTTTPVALPGHPKPKARSLLSGGGGV